MMKWIIVLSVAVFVFGQSLCFSSITSQRIKFYDEAKIENFNENELEILKPFIDLLQLQYNKMLASIDLSRNLKTVDDSQSLLEFKNLLLSIQPDFSFDVESDFHYNISLPRINNLNEFTSRKFSSAEANDIQDIFEENIDHARETIRNLVEQSDETEARLTLSINKIKIVKFIYKMVQKVYGLGIQGGRTAYCTYSSVPAINSTLREGSHDIGSCYNYTETSIGRLRRDVKTAIHDIRANVQELIRIYRRLAKRNSLLGKLLTVVLNIQKITMDIKETNAIAIATIDEVKTDGPIIAFKVKECAKSSIPNFINKLNETITHLITCINFVDDSIQDPEPEPESSEEILLNPA